MSEYQLKEPEPDPGPVTPHKKQQIRCVVCYSEAKNWDAVRSLSQVRTSIAWPYFLRVVVSLIVIFVIIFCLLLVMFLYTGLCFRLENSVIYARSSSARATFC